MEESTRIGGDVLREKNEVVPTDGLTRKIWHHYCSWAVRNQIPVSLVDETIGSLLYWAPANDKDHSSQWREVLWGCLQFHRLAFDIATNPSRLDQNYGTSIHVDPGVNAFHATGMRVAITVLQSLSPVAQELVRCRSDSTRTARRQAIVRSWVERLRFLARICLLGSYWRRMLKEHHAIDPGLLLNGGMFYPVQAPTVGQELSNLERQNYVGRRTGIRLGSRREQRLQLPTESRGLIPINKLRLLVGELLYVCRPVVTAEAETNSILGTPLKAWLLALGMDVLSLRCLRLAAREGNPLTKSEVKRRMMRLFLYFLRAPIWDRITCPTIDHVDAKILQRMPLLGKLISNYCWEIMFYWKGFGAEEG